MVLVLAACDPIPHPTVVVHEVASSPVTFRLLAGNGRHVVVTSTGPSATVPGAGAWRVDRTTGETVPLPDAGVPRRISGDGRRILLSDGTVWMAGGVYVPPSEAVLSPDLRAVAYPGLDDTIESRLIPDGPVWAVEADFPRPPGTVAVAATAIADDGRTVGYRLTVLGSPAVVRFVDLDAGNLVERDDESIDVGEGYVQDRFALAADGSRFAHLHEDGTYDFGGGTTDLGESWVELIDVATGDTVTHWDSTTGHVTRTLHIGSFGREAWVYQERTLNQPGRCPGTPTIAICVVASTAVAVEAGGAHVAAVAPGRMRTVNASRNGRFLLVDNALTPFSANSHVTVVDWLSGTSETLASPETYTETGLQCAVFGQSAPCTLGIHPSNAQISDDGRTVASQAGTVAPGPTAGWYEHSAAP